MSTDGRLLSVDEAADRVGLRHAALRRAVQRGELPAMKLCGRIRIEPAELDRWMRRHVIAGPEMASVLKAA